MMEYVVKGLLILGLIAFIFLGVMKYQEMNAATQFCNGADTVSNNVRYCDGKPITCSTSTCHYISYTLGDRHD